MNKQQAPTRKRTASQTDTVIVVSDFRRPLPLLQELAATHGPYFTWEAIQDCIKHGEEFPQWVKDYLRQCADRMMSDHGEDHTDKAKRARSGKAKRTADSRKRLLWIFDFPKQTKPGPGSRLDPMRSLLEATEQHEFAYDFARRVQKGEAPVKARANACDLIFGEVKEDSTLRKYLKEAFGVKRLPVTKQGWDLAIHRFFTKK